MQRKVKLSKICEGLLDTLMSPNVTRTEGKGCDNMSVIILDFRQNKWGREESIIIISNKYTTIYANIKPI